MSILFFKRNHNMTLKQGCQSEGFLLGFGLIRKSEKLIQNCSDSRKSEIRNPNLVYEKCTL